ncbi:MAG TPA: endonuclease/exonuclease/phosphatase family protein [Bryobacteraceae bacterium]|nr:endonuclease/exonuclease/phosphatase family protein [Bryobacteraceae bacterium]
MVKLLAWNIQHGGGGRLARIVEEISAYDADVIAVTEFRANPGVTLCAALKERGLPYIETTCPTGNQNGIAVFSRTPMRRTRPCPAPSDSLVRWLDLDLPEHGFGIGVLHVMAAGSHKKHPTNLAKTRFWDAMLQAAEARLQEPFLFLGDWNTGAHRLDETGRTFMCSEHFLRLSTLGWTDMWRHHNPGITEYTWFSKLKGGARGNGFRLDHAFATPSLVPRITSCRYSHREREAGISDHSMVIVEAM